jgi:hypothetical protein
MKDDDELARLRRFLVEIDRRLADAIEYSQDRQARLAIDIMHAIQRDIRVKVQ